MENSSPTEENISHLRQQMKPYVDDETREAVNNILATKKFLEHAERDISFLELTKNELTEMADSSTGFGKNEFFDLQYFSSEAERCWKERKDQDASPASISTVKLFPNESAILKDKEIRESRARAVEDMASPDFALKHPLLYRRIERNKERRALFHHALTDSGVMSKERIEMSSINASTQGLFGVVVANNNSNNGGSTGGGGGGGGDTTSKKQGTPPLGGNNRSAAAFSSVPNFSQEKLRKLQQEDAAKQLLKKRQTEEAAAAATSNIHGAVEEQEGKQQQQQQQSQEALLVPKGPLSLKDLLAQQKELMVKMVRHDEEIYKPLFATFVKYDESVQQKLMDLADAVTGTKEEEEARLLALQLEQQEHEDREYNAYMRAKKEKAAGENGSGTDDDDGISETQAKMEEDEVARREARREQEVMQQLQGTVHTGFTSSDDSDNSDGGFDKEY